MVRRCCAGHCSNTKDKDKGICLHTFPHGDKKRLALWNNFVKTKTKDWTKASATSLLCSAHFLESDFTNFMEFRMGFAGLLFLKDTAVPSIHSIMATGTSTSVCDEVASHTQRSGKPRTAAVKLSLHRHLQVAPSTSSEKNFVDDSLESDAEVQQQCDPESFPGISNNEPVYKSAPEFSVVLQSITRATQYSRKHLYRNKGCQITVSKCDKTTQVCKTETEKTSFDTTPQVPLCSTPRKRSLETDAPNFTPIKLIRLSSPEDTPVKKDDDPDYHPSNLSFEEEETEKEVESQSQSDTIPSIPPADKEMKYLVFQSCLEELFRSCPLCAGESRALFPPTKTGTAITVTQICQEVSCGFKRTWNSQPKVGRYYAGNIMASASLLFSGNQFSKINRYFKYLQVPFVSKTAYEEHQNKFLFPVIENTWQQQQKEMVEEVKTLGEGLHIAGDGRADSPGHSAKYGTYTTMELHLGKVINIQLVQSNEVKNSNWMELEGLKRSIDCLKKQNLALDVIVTDRHRSVAKWIRENLCKIPSIILMSGMWLKVLVKSWTSLDRCKTVAW